MLGAGPKTNLYACSLCFALLFTSGKNKLTQRFLADPINYCMEAGPWVVIHANVPANSVIASFLSPGTSGEML